MNVLLINTNREKSPQALVPLGVCCVASATRAAGHEVEVLDLCFERNPVQAVEQVVSWQQPDAIGISVRNLDNCDYLHPHSYLPEVKRIVSACRRQSNAQIILGGPAVSQSPGELARYCECRYAVSGEGEYAFPALLRAIEREEEDDTIPGVSQLTPGGIIHSPERLEVTLDDLPDPDITRWVDLRHYRQHGASYPIQTKRGCIYSCRYCDYPQLEGRHWRLRDPAWVAEEVSRAAAAGMRLVEFVDSVFGFPTAHAIACCEAIAALKNRLPLATANVNPAACTPELIAAMNAAGFTTVGISAESGSEQMLQRLGKDYSLAELASAVENLAALQAQKLWVFIAGYPGESDRTLRETMSFINELPHRDFVFVTQGIRVLPNTELQAELLATGVLDSNASLIHPVFFHSPLVSVNRLREMLAEGTFPAANITTLHDGGHRLIPFTQWIVNTLGLPPPYWRYLPRLNQVKRLLGV